jgi:hypothetical protein
MPVGFIFSKAKTERFLDCLANGKPFIPTQAQWTVDDMLALAGACYFGAMSHGPVRLSDREWSEIPREHREAAEDTSLKDLGAAVMFYGELTQKVRDCDYDEACEPECSGAVFTSEDGMHLVPFKGFRGHN